MKKGIRNLAIATMVGVASMGIMTGCQIEEDKPYIQVAGLDTAYIQNEEINLEGAKILYYSDKKDTTADEIKLTESMVANFSTDTTGEKKMKVFFNSCELEIDYKVISKTDFINTFNTAYTNLLQSDYIHTSITTTYVNDADRVHNGEYNIQNNKCYNKINDNGVQIEIWTEKHEENWYEYRNINGEKKRKLITVSSDNVLERLGLIPIGAIDEDFLNDGVNISYDENGSQIKMYFTHESEVSDISFTIENNKIVQFDFILNEGGDDDYYAIETFSYNEEDVNMVDLPTDADTWTLVE